MDTYMDNKIGGYQYCGMMQDFSGRQILDINVWIIDLSDDTTLQKIRMIHWKPGR